MRIRSIMYGLMLTVLIAGGLAAAPTVPSVGSENMIYITAGTSKLIKLDYDVRNMAVGNPEVSDILIMSKREILVNGKAAGITTLTLWDEARHHDYNVIVNKSSEELVFKRYQLYNIPLIFPEWEDANNIFKVKQKPIEENVNDIKNILSGYLKPEQYSVNPWLNAVFVVASAEDHKLIEQLITNVDVKQKQVLLKVEVYEIKLNNKQDYGLELFYQKDQSTAQYNKGGDGFTYTFSSAADLVESSTHIFKLMLSEGKAKLLATPKILSVNNRYSLLSSGEKFPLVQTDNQGNKTVEYIYTGIVLGVIPNINENGDIDCWIYSDASSVAGYTDDDYPIVRTRSTKSEVRVKNNGMLIMGGLIQENDNITTHKLPILGDLLGWVPVLGSIVKNDEIEKVRTEIVVTLRPTVIFDDADATAQLSEVQ